MKRAGRKNQGCWFRTNKAIKGVLSNTEKSSLETLLAADPSIAALFTVIQTQMGTLGITIPGAAAGVGDWITQLMEKGIPLQIWMGKPTFTTYERVGDAGSYEYFPEYLQEYQDAGEAFRKLTGQFFFGRRQFRDVMNVGRAEEGNPGGYPDAQEDPPNVES